MSGTLPSRSRPGAAPLKKPAAHAPQELLTLRQAAAYAVVSVSTLRRWVRDGLLPVYRAGRQIRIDRADLVAVLRGSSAAGSL